MPLLPHEALLKLSFLAPAFVFALQLLRLQALGRASGIAPSDPKHREHVGLFEDGAFHPTHTSLGPLSFVLGVLLARIRCG